jgi:hypothetical protein
VLIFVKRGSMAKFVRNSQSSMQVHVHLKFLIKARLNHIVNQYFILFKFYFVVVFSMIKSEIVIKITRFLEDQIKTTLSRFLGARNTF